MLTFYPLGDRVPGVAGIHQSRYAAVKAGEYRYVNPGEWYLSGAIPTAFRFVGATGQPTAAPYPIARIVRRPTDADTKHLIQLAEYAVADFRILAAELGETDPQYSPALRAASRLAQALKPFTEGVS